MMVVEDAGVENSDEGRHQEPHRHAESIKDSFGLAHIQFNLEANTPHELSSSDTDTLNDPYSSDTDSQEIGLEEVDMSEEEPSLDEILSYRRSIKSPMEPSVAGTWLDEEPDDDMVDSSSRPNDDLIEMSYDEVDMTSPSNDENPEITNPVVKRRSILDDQK
jgi:hypothetical protein